MDPNSPQLLETVWQDVSQPLVALGVSPEQIALLRSTFYLGAGTVHMMLIRADGTWRQDANLKDLMTTLGAELAQSLQGQWQALRAPS